MSGARAKRSSSRATKSGKRVAKASDSSMKKTSPMGAAFIRKHWPAKGRAQRIARAEQSWKEAMEIASSFKKLDAETVKWLAEDPDLEYL
jgi:hypothetical protein